MRLSATFFVMTGSMAFLPASSAMADQCQASSKSALQECSRACTDKSCRNDCTVSYKASLGECRAKPGAAALPGLKGAGTASNPFQVGMGLKETALSLGGGKSDVLYFALTADKPAKIRLYLMDYTAPVDVTLEQPGSKDVQTVHFIKAPDYPAYGRFEIEEGSYVYRVQLVDAPTSFKLRAVVDENCAIETQFYRIPFGGTCRD